MNNISDIVQYKLYNIVTVIGTMCTIFRTLLLKNW